MNDPKSYENIAELLRSLPKETLSRDFDNRFWKRFDEELSAAPVLGWASFITPLKIAVPVAILALVGLMVIPHAFVDKPSVTITQGKVLIQDKGSTAVRNLRGQQILSAGDRIQTNEAGWLILELENRYRIKLHPDSELIIQNLKSRFTANETVLELVKGQTLVSIGAENHMKYPLRILTPNAFARAMGTQFMVAAPSQAHPNSMISVVTGTVKVGATQSALFGKRSVAVTSGYEASLGLRQSEVKIEKIVESRRMELEELFQFGKKNQVILLISMSPGRVRELLTPCPIYIRIESRDSALQSLAAIADDILKATRDEDKIEHIKAIHAMEEAVDNQTDLDRVPLLLFIGAYYAHLHEYEEASWVFQRIYLQYADSSYASLAMMADAVLRQEHLENKEEAEALKKKIMSLYPHSFEAKAVLEN